jgi:sugar transferase EpsL
MNFSKKIYARGGKRVFDAAVSAIALLVLAPILLVAVVLVRWKLGRPVLYRQLRPGKDGVPFLLYKLRTMTESRDAVGNLLPDEERATRVGRLLRSTSIDEVPELWNVLRGDMSLVGPRPLLMEYLGRYTEEEARRHEVRSGITGWAQINGRNAIRFAERFKLDVWYVDHVSLWLDSKILWLTVWKTLRREDIDQAGGEMEVFKGTAGP